MKIMNFFKNNINKYSFQSIAWTFWLQICVLSLFILTISILPQDLSYDIEQALTYIIEIIIFVLFIPILILINSFTFFSYLFFKEKEIKFPNFTIKNKFLTTNPIYIFLCIISYIVEVFFIVLSSILILRMFILDFKENLYCFVIFCCPVLLILFLLYLLARKIFIHKKLNP